MQGLEDGSERHGESPFLRKPYQHSSVTSGNSIWQVPPSVRSSVNRVSQRPTGNGAVTFANAAIYKGEYNPEVFVHESAHSFDW